MSAPAVSATLFLLAALGYVIARRAPNWRRNLRFARAFRAGREFYASYAHVAKDVAYGDLPRQNLDVYWPPTGDRLPVLLFAYGGSWSWGEKSLYPLVGARFTAQGCVVVVINYRLYPRVTFPAFVEDAAAAIAWTARHIADYRGDPGRLFVAGHSAGGHILSLIALDDRYLAVHGLRRDVLRGVVVVNAPIDLETELAHLEAHPSISSADGLRAIMGGSATLPAADPIRRVRADAPPMLLLYGQKDTLVPLEVARRFASALRSAGAPVELREYPDADHYSLLLEGVRVDPRRPMRLVSDALAFIRRIDSS